MYLEVGYVISKSSSKILKLTVSKCLVLLAVVCLHHFELCLYFQQNIFLGEDIRKQLPRESAEFDDVNANWKVTTFC